MSRLKDIIVFYEFLANLERRLDGKSTLENCNGKMSWPKRGVYFFFEPGEERNQTGIGPRVVRVGTHALKEHSRSSLWNRLKQHKGIEKDGGGNHRGSIFRSFVGSALMSKDDSSDKFEGTWGIGADASREIRLLEKPLEQSVSQYIKRMPFLWLEVEDEPGPNSMRGTIERNSIALLSNYKFINHSIESPSSSWLGYWSNSEKVRKSGLWNSNHVNGDYDQDFIIFLENR